MELKKVTQLRHIEEFKRKIRRKLRVVHTEAILFLKSVSERSISDIERP